MKVLDRSITAWQTGIILFILLFANKILILPSLLYEDAKLEAFLVPIFLFVLELGLIFLFYRIKTKYPSERFSDILKNHYGKFVTYSLYVLILVFFFCKALLLYNVTYIFFRNMIYKDSGNILFLFCFLPVVNHLAIIGLRVIGRTAQLFFPVIIFISLFCICIGFFGINSSPLLYQASINDVFRSCLKHISAFGDSIFLFIFMDKIKIQKGQWKIVFSFAGIAMLFVVTITTVFILSYTYTSFMHPFAIFEIMSYVKEFGGLGRIDIISMVLIIILTYFQLALYLKGFMESFHVIFSKIDNIYSVLTFNIVFVLAVNYVVLNLSKGVIYGETILPYFSIISFVFIPALVVVMLLKKRRKERKKWNILLLIFLKPQCFWFLL